MTFQIVNLGSAPNAGDGDPLRTALQKVNNNFALITEDAISAITSVSAGFTAAAFHTYLVDTSGGSVTGTLPASPELGTTVKFVDVTGSFDSFSFTVDRNGENIDGVAANSVLSTEYGALELTYYGGNVGWKTS